ncbi:FMO1 [Candida theae]|uniref:FMO1 n=1 Tax=Candida theae TaxID=1198502 RepID=A0AAD5BIN7_9ASCO|nr:FMO1 [Candida theae]KAI5966666.1 FMO1 [Candida theae]
MTKAQPLFSRIAIVGGGPAGLAAAKALAMEPVEFAAIDVFERRDHIGGLWYHNGNKSLIHPHVPSTDPLAGEIADKNATTSDLYFSAIYKFMETNISHSLMSYRDDPFPKGTFTFPERSKVWKYIEDYAATIPHEMVNISKNSNVTRVEKVNKVWEVDVEIDDKSSSCLEYDAVIIANGHFNTPFIPNVEGLSEWNENIPHSILHSKYFESPNTYRGKTVLVIGNAASGVDISTQLSTVAQQVYVSVRDLDNIGFQNDLIQYIDLIERYDWKQKSVVTKSGDTHDNIDVVIFCTGYLYSMPFLQSDVIKEGTQVYDLYKQIFNIYDPSLTFVALLKNIIPMPLSESQSALIARYYSGRYELPSVDERQKSYEKDLAEKGSGSKFHLYGYPLDVEYYRHLQELIDKQGLRTPGLVAPIWDKELTYERSVSGELKGKRLQQLVDHVKKLRSEGKDFELPQ